MTLKLFLVILISKHILSANIFTGFTGTLSDCIKPEMKCPNSNITFWLYTRSTQNNPIELDMNYPEQNFQAGFNKKLPTKIIIHGYTGFKDYSPNKEIRPAFFQKGDYNIISLDYKKLVRSPCYITAAANVPLVGKCTAELIDYLVDNQIIEFNSLHIIGFSLGAQVSGQIANFIKNKPIPRITGLDPAMPLFVSLFKQTKLESTDAKYVDIIHTNALTKGKLESCGHADFYVNGGLEQPGCISTNEESASSCYHRRAPEYYAESINTEVGFYGRKCANWFIYALKWCNLISNQDDVQLMGEYINVTSAKGNYFLKTNSESPFAMGLKGSEF